MSGDTIVEAVKQKISRLQEAKSKVEDTLRTEVQLEWGTDAVIRRQDLRHEHGVITSRIRSLLQMEAEGMATSSHMFEVEHNGKIRIFRLVPSHLVDPSNGLISPESTFGQILLRSAVGAVFSFETPRGLSQYYLLSRH
jgi:hypothetical protein